MSSEIEAGITQAELVERVRAQLQGRPVGARGGRVASAPGTGLLYGVMLHAGARWEAGEQLTDLETKMLEPLFLMLPKEDLREVGRVYTQEVSARGCRRCPRV
ncbi:hypothetical protein ACFWB1_37595 [Streptomyces goshikiensis]|uniref:hypothetical protein n=1 Tax=Streptomyces goshikiensis TaxID=1942 RepID=UPI00367D979A